MRRPFAFAALCAALVLSLVTGAPGRAQPGKKAGEKPARVVVYLPEAADLFVEGTRCPLKSPRRAFNTAPLEPGKRYEYTLRAEITKDDTKVGVTLTALVRAGETTEVRFGDEKSFLAAGGLEKPEAKPRDKEPVRLPTAPAPWFVLAELDEDSDMLWKVPGSADRYLLRDGAFKAALASGTSLEARALSARLAKFAPVVVSANAKPLAPEYLALLAPGALVVVPKGDFPDRPNVNRTILFGAARCTDPVARVRWSTAPPASGGSNVVRETSVEVPLRDLTGYSATGRLSQLELTAALATERPVLLAETGFTPDAALLAALDKKALLLVLPVPFREP